MVRVSIGQMQGKASERREIILRYIDRARRSLDAADADDKLNCGQKRETRGRSSAGRAPALQAGGQEFDSPRLHQILDLEN